MSEGFLMIATGDDYIEEAKESVKSIISNSSRPVSIVTDQKIDSDMFDKIIIDDDPTYSMIDKLRNLKKTPYDKTVYMDTDAYLVEPVPELFNILDKYDIATTIDPNEYGGRLEKDKHFHEIPESIPIFQCGVITYVNNDTFSKFVRSWSEIHKRNRETLRSDQSSFRLAIYNSDVKHLVLSDLYNCLIKWPMQVTGEVKIAHGRLAQATVQDIEDINTSMNMTDRPRLFYYPPNGNIYAPAKSGLNSLILPPSKFLSYSYSIKNLLRLFYSSYQRRGLIETLRRGARYVMWSVS